MGNVDSANAIAKLEEDNTHFVSMSATSEQIQNLFQERTMSEHNGFHTIEPNNFMMSERSVIMEKPNQQMMDEYAQKEMQWNEQKKELEMELGAMTKELKHERNEHQRIMEV